ncbi:Kinesin 6 [Lecanosticta acicola]|uniref:Kinesin 6 n=1 Tax=Lecanosticta acicola TaxID=111012 RepID=A0AAI8Z2K3_9PEZI|nr:Kinesin 6 [Lecanosticta acicola]
MAATAGARTDGASSIQVAVRLRPFTVQEAAQLQKSDDGPLFLGDGSLAAAPKTRLGQKGIRSVVKVLDEKTLIFDPPDDNAVHRFGTKYLPSGKKTKDQTYGFDKVFDENATQVDVYEATTKNLLDSVMDGYNATVFAYGATGCGKTHTITGTSASPGIIFMTMQELFEKVDEVNEAKESEITLSYLEIYNETIRDLLNPDASGKQSLMLREDNQQAVSVADLTSHRPQNVQEVMDMVIRGNAARTQSPTEANATSSRSHAVLQVNVSLKDRDASVHEPVTFATLSIIDLAGSERASATKNRGARLQEGANINKSLLALGSCINALCDQRGKTTHVPYRNSKLTRLLKFSLGGNCRTVMIVCISPSSVHYDETQNTLRYANRAKNIQTKSVRNIFNVDRHVKDYVKKIEEQRQTIDRLNAAQKNHDEIALAKVLKLEGKKYELFKACLQRIRLAYAHSSQERGERITIAVRLSMISNRISIINAWIGNFDDCCANREDEEPPASLLAFRKTATGILIELEASRQHQHQQEQKNNWTRAIETALAEGRRQLQSLKSSSPDIAISEDDAVDSVEALALHMEVDKLKMQAELDMNHAIMKQLRGSEAGLMHILQSSQFEAIAIMNQMLHMSEEDAVKTARSMLGKVFNASIESLGQVIKPDGGLQIVEAVPPSRAGTPKKKKLMLKEPTPIKDKIRLSMALEGRASPNATSSPKRGMKDLPRSVAADMHPPTPRSGPSPARGHLASPKRRVKVGGLGRKAFTGSTPKKRSPTKKQRSVRWPDQDDADGSLVEYSATPKAYYSGGSPFKPTHSQSDTNEAANASQPAFTLTSDPNTLQAEIPSSPLPAPPVASSEASKAPGTGRFATGFLSKKGSSDNSSPTLMPPPPFLSLASLSSDDESSPLRAIAGNGLARAKSKRKDSPMDSRTNSDLSASSCSESDKKEIGAVVRQRKRTSIGTNTAARVRSRESIQHAHRRRSPAASSPPSDTSFSGSSSRRFPGHREDVRHSILSPNFAPITKRGPALTHRRSMVEMNGTPRTDAYKAPVRPGGRVSSVVPGSFARPGSSAGTKGPWR